MKKVQIIDGKKPCSKCKKNLPTEEFSRNNGASCGLHSCCMGCIKQYHDNKSEELKLRERQNKIKYKLNNYYGLSIEEYESLLEAQNHCCAICKKHKSSQNRMLFVDHDHSTRQVRGLLCRKCNLILGFSEDNLETLNEAISYLKVKRN